MEFTIAVTEYCRIHALAKTPEFVRLTAETIREVALTPDPDGPTIKCCPDHEKAAAASIRRVWAFGDVETPWLEEILNPAPAPEPESNGEASGEPVPTPEGGESFEYAKPEGVPNDAGTSVADILGDIGDDGDPGEEPQANIRTMGKALMPDEMSQDGKVAFKDWRKARANGKALSPRASNEDKQAWAAGLTPQEQAKYVKSWK